MKKAIVLPVVILGLLTGACGSNDAGSKDAAGGTRQTQSAAPSTPPASEEPSSPTPTTIPFDLPALKGDTQDSVVQLLSAHLLPAGLITNRPAHDGISLPSDDAVGDWVVCSATPARGSRITESSEIRLYLAETTGQCVKPTVQATPEDTTDTDADADTGGGLHTCSNDGSQLGYACTSNGKVVEEGQFCPRADRGRTLKATNGRMATCEDYNGWRWNA